MFINKITSERVNTGWWNLYIVWKFRPSLNLGVAAALGVRIPKNVAFGYDIGEISAGCLVGFVNKLAIFSYLIVLCFISISCTLCLGGRMVRTSDSRLVVEGSPPDYDTAWLFISETGDRLWRVNCFGNCNHHLGQLSLASLGGR